MTSNPGLKSRFDKQFNFEDHGTAELLTVCTEQFEKAGKVLSTEAHAIIEQYISHLSEQRQNGFGNAREIRKIVNEVLKNQKFRWLNYQRQIGQNLLNRQLNSLMFWNSKRLKLNTAS